MSIRPLKFSLRDRLWVETKTVVPLRLFINGKGLAKLVVGIARGKKEYDKRQSIKERDDKRALARLMHK